MAKPSSTSSSRPLPRALAIALIAVAALEAAIRLAPPDAVIPYSSGEPEYYAARNYIQAHGSAPVAFVGSSRAKEGIVVPLVRERLAAAGAKTRVANYACAGARADEMRALVEFALDHDPPRVLLVGVSPRALLGDDLRWARSAIFWTAGDWWAHAHQDFGEAAAILPEIARNYLSRWLHLFRYRLKPTVVFDETWRVYELDREGQLEFSLPDLLAGRALPNPMSGGYTFWQRFRPDRSLVNTPISDAHVQEYVRRLLVDGRYPLGQRRVDELVALAQAGRERGVAVVFFEVPVSELLKRHYPPGVYDGFLARLREVSERSGAPFHSADDLGLQLTDHDFAEQSHLNRTGADKLTAAVTERIVLPALRGRE